ncbi:Predicted NTP pyrophosphohydrolase [Sphingobacterium spiritivorum]|uniref:Predicted NTP pyrophosphohydrolase n=1 Tax=Sphingobacterium spiritivorum TaxID=258 RepID=A0A380CU53_SPHSI|nr:NUDIX domain-containing protein [Sphingobacterium spiritivorum]SUJ28480.1 Predicted NTP pyrophosphohydrolase [Sphingobacterium spiritivorum]
MNQSVLILTDFVPKNIENPQTIGIQEIDLEKLFAQSAQSATPVTYLYIHPEFEVVFKKILDKAKIIKAAGGLVENGEGGYLFIFRLGHWDLPKGKVEESEKMKVAAVREVEEETGVKIDYLGPKLITTYHTYYMRGKFVLKATNWYRMGINKVPKLIPQHEEDITAAEWLTPARLKKVKENTYPLILDVIKKIRK